MKVSNEKSQMNKTQMKVSNEKSQMNVVLNEEVSCECGLK